MKQIKYHCTTCKGNYMVERTPEIKPNVELIESNWCPDCEEKGILNEEWTERHIEREVVKFVDKNQTNLL